MNPVTDPAKKSHESKGVDKKKETPQTPTTAREATNQPISAARCPHQIA
jgi:hypothetical protein